MLALGELRNSVMHGFFVLPPERNRLEANNIASLLIDLLEAGFFNCKGDFHFFRRGAFTGHWVITEPSQWIALQGDTSFGKLVSSVILEQGDAFWAAEQTRFENYGGYNVPDRLKDFVKNNVKGSFAWWLHPNDVNADRKSASIAQWLFSQPDIITIAYGLHPSGLSYTSSFLIKRLIQVLNPSGRTFGKKTSDKEKVISLRKECNKKVVIFIDTIHVGLFNEQHVICLKDFMYANNIILIATGHHYSYFDSYFNSSDAEFHPLNVPTVDQRIACLLNYLRFKGPFHDKIEDKPHVELLLKIMSQICDAVSSGDVVVARRFADAHVYPLEYVLEIFSVLGPWVKAENLIFNEDKVEDPYVYPSEITETTIIYLNLGRRDLTLEYRHKTLSL
jgi:hypothetical protein